MAVMTHNEIRHAVEMASKEDVRFALLAEHALNLYSIGLVIRKDNYSVYELASTIKEDWERWAFRMNRNTNLSHMDYTELMAVIINLMQDEFKLLGFSRKEFMELCSELQ